MDSASSRQITDLLKAWGAGDHAALDRLAPAIDQELRRLAKAYLKREPHEQTLQTTALINEAYLRLIEIRDLPWQDRAHFFAISAQMMRRILVDAARSRRSEKRGGRASQVCQVLAWSLERDFHYACSSPDKIAKERASWDAAARMTAEAWLSGSVSTRFAADLLDTAAHQTKSSQYEPLKDAIQKHEPSPVRNLVAP